jgi:glycosyltransferase involved in cell wall biosynthesis
VLSIPNPAPYENIGSYTKKKELLYVGRINTTQKRLDLLLLIWKALHTRFEEWSLNIVGDGEELDMIKDKSKEYNLTNIYFHGECDPRPFYERASIFCLTSSFEGLPMTLLESMQFGVVPIAFNSFPAVIDLIESGVNGYVIEPFNIDEYVNKVSVLISDEHDLDKFSKASLNKIKEFDMEHIGLQWDCLFDKLGI